MGSEPTVFLVACVVSLGLTALIREIAPRIGLTDNPDGDRKLHGHAIPLGGGVAIYLTSAIILLTLWLVPNEFYNQLRGAGLPGLLLAGLVLVVVGLIDDKRGLLGKHKLLGQIVAALILMANGLLINDVTVFGFTFSFGWFAYPLTLFWLLGAVNALNLLDGADGLATMLGIILSCTIAVMAVVLENPAVAVIAMVFAGSLLGFMRFNFPPASIFLGDAGSMLIGLVVGALAISGSLEPEGTVLLAAPVAVWTIPIFDSVAAILRRKLTGRSIYTTDRGHLHHRLLNLLGSNTKVLGWVAFCCVFISIAALIGLVRKEDWITLLTCLSVVAIFIATGIFGRAELLLVGNRLRNVGRMFVSPIVSQEDKAWEKTIRLHGSRQWELLWSSLVESSDCLRLTAIRLDVSVPVAQDAYHASWVRPTQRRGDRDWSIEIPLVVKNRTIGRVRISGERDGQSACMLIQQLVELIEPFEARLLELEEEQAATMATKSVVMAGPQNHGGDDSIPPAKYPK